MSINKSKPVYSPLQADLSGRFHLLLGFAEGGAALQRVIAGLRAGAPDSLESTRVLLAGAAIDPFLTLGLAGAQWFETAAGLLKDYRELLERSLMGTRLYIAGPESFIGSVMQVALEFNLNLDEVRAEAQGTLARRVRCVHCRATTEDVRTNIARCSGCSRWLTVRDHYSRRFAAYMGVMADAEAPGELPRTEEIYP
jgi:hypothetical protein